MGSEFEVASIRVVPPGPQIRVVGQHAGPGSSDPTSWTYENASVSSLVGFAYDKRPYEVCGSEWMETDRFGVTAKVAPGTTKEQFRLMVRNLLAEHRKSSRRRGRLSGDAPWPR